MNTTWACVGPETQQKRTEGFKGESVEVDAIPPRKLRDLVSECITTHIDDDDVWRKSERQALQMMAGKL